MPKDDKTEKATPKRRNESRKRGEVAKSSEMNSAAVLAAGVIGLMVFGPQFASGLAGTMRTVWGEASNASAVTSASGLHNLFEIVLKTMESTVAPIAAGCALAGILVNVAQIGFRPTLTPLKPDVKKLNPWTGAKNVFGARIGIETFKALSKVSVVGAVAAMTLVPMIRHLQAGVGTTPAALGGLLGSSAMSIIERVVMAYMLIAILDLVWQRRHHSKSLRMSKQEVKEEGKSANLPPEVKAALRRRQVQAARARMMAAVPNADVVVTNPTHYAVALRYDGTKPAPVVVAKGKNLVAAQIRRIATENDVPIVPDPPLARSLHASVKLDQMIPAELFAAVAQVLAFVYKMAGRRRVMA
jgi:flagellar biosynthetic protein FlhB